MGKTINPQLESGAIRKEDIELDPRSRDDIPALVIELQRVDARWNQAAMPVPGSMWLAANGNGPGWSSAVACSPPRAVVQGTSRTEEPLKAREIDPISLAEDIDTTCTASEPVFHAFASTAHSRRRTISRRTKGGLPAAGKRGRTLGRPSVTAGTVPEPREPADSGAPVTEARQFPGMAGPTPRGAIHPARS